MADVSIQNDQCENLGGVGELVGATNPNVLPSVEIAHAGLRSLRDPFAKRRRVALFGGLRELSGGGISMGLRDTDLARVLLVERVELAAGAPENIAQHDGAIKPRLL